jgi:hypothetical protein
VIAEGVGRVRIAERDAAILARARYTRLAGSLREAADTAERAAGMYTDLASLAYAERTADLRAAAVVLRYAAEDADGMARP